jgi:hypothetical protein
MEERFFLDGIEMESTGITVCQGIELPILVYAVAAVAAVLGFEQALVGAEFAKDVLAGFQIMPGLLDPAAFLPQFPELSGWGVAFENRGCGVSFGSPGKKENGRSATCQAGQSGYAVFKCIAPGKRGPLSLWERARVRAIGPHPLPLSRDGRGE